MKWTKYHVELAVANGGSLAEEDLRDVDLECANLKDARLQDADLYGANLDRANLQGANLRGADLQRANLQGANLQGANLRGADLEGANLGDFSIVPATGKFTAYKKLRDEVIATLEIPAEAKRVSVLTGRKCRAEYVRVVALSDGYELGEGKYCATPYAVGETVYADSYDDDVRFPCTHGIHFFLTEAEARNY